MADHFNYRYKICEDSIQLSSCKSDLDSLGISYAESSRLETDANGITRQVTYIYINKWDRIRTTLIGRMIYPFRYVVLIAIVVLASAFLLPRCMGASEPHEPEEIPTIPVGPPDPVNVPIEPVTAPSGPATAPSAAAPSASATVTKAPATAPSATASSAPETDPPAPDQEAGEERFPGWLLISEK